MRRMKDEQLSTSGLSQQPAATCQQPRLGEWNTLIPILDISAAGLVDSGPPTCRPDLLSSNTSFTALPSHLPKLGCWCLNKQ